ncbi:MAG TPA: N-acetyltransferase [Anaerolineaceae bacterium]|nr:N-acetyltransferase [Anaerolineaceae bacterium]
MQSNPSAFQILPASWRDLFALRRLENECFPEDAWPMIDLIGVLTLPGIMRLKAVIDDQMVGFVAGDTNRDRKVNWIVTIGVQTAQRRKGIGLALLQACEEKMHAQAIRLCVRRSNLGAIQLYQGTGYATVDVWKSYYNGGEDALVLEKQK